eukprot:8521933-Alexandrium_andersonii.AAC.1
MEEALHEQPEVPQPKRSCSPSPAQLVGRTEIPMLQLGPPGPAKLALTEPPKAATGGASASAG